MVGVLGLPGERSLLHARSQGDGSRASLTLPKPLGRWHRFFSMQMETGSWGVTTLGRLTQNPADSLVSSTEGGCWSRSGWEPSPRVQPHCLGGLMVGTGMGMEQTLEQPRHLHQTSQGVPSAPEHVRGGRMCCTPGLAEAGRCLERVRRGDQAPTTPG